MMTALNSAAGPEAQLGSPSADPSLSPFQLPPVLPSLNNTYGAVLLGTFFSLMLYGVAIHQAYRYARHHFKDSLIIKCFVAFIMISDTFHTVVSMHISYWYLVTNYFRPDHLAAAVWSIKLLSLSTAVGIIACQSFFAYRVYIVGKHLRPVVVVACVLFLAELGLALTGTIQAFLFGNLDSFRKLSWLNSAGFGVAVAADVLLTSVLIWVLHQSRTGFQRTNSMIDLLIAYTVCTGLITDLVSLVGLIAALVAPGNWMYVGTDLVSNKIYVNAVLAALNFRQAFSTHPEGYNSYVKPIGISMHPRSGSAATEIGKNDILNSTTAHNQSTAKLPPILDIEAMA